MITRFAEEYLRIESERRKAILDGRYKDARAKYYELVKTSENAFKRGILLNDLLAEVKRIAPRKIQ